MAGAHITLKIVDAERYGTKVAEVFAGGKFLQAEQVRSGMAYIYERYLNNCPDAVAVHRAEAIALCSSAWVYGGRLFQTLGMEKTATSKQRKLIGSGLSINCYYFFCRVPLLSSSMLAFNLFKNVGTALYRLCSARVGCSDSGKLINSSNAASIFRSTFSF